ncbi:putative hypothetical protein [Symbiodinium microadriaticum]|nr:putative hypothetical protein [Symbiodinium microadriaticum]
MGLYHSASQDMGPSELTVLDYVGISLWVVGFLLETIADLQKQQWSMIKADKKFIKTGLWSISRHPNYFGEITLWVGIAITTSCSFVYPAQWMALLSPAFVAFLLVHVSGIPLLEKAADEKWEQDEEYRKYKESVPVLIPFVGRKGDAKF